MNVNGFTNGVGAYAAYDNSKACKNANKNAPSETKPQGNTVSDLACTYEPSSTEEAAPDNTAAVFEKAEEVKEAKETKYVPNTELIAKMKADAEARTEQLRSLVEKIILQQANKNQDIFEFLGKEYSAEDIEKAKEDISEDGYYGVKQTSQRILDFAVALTGGDPDKIESMREAFKQGYEMAEKTWGGELPDICKQTYDAVFEGFDKMAEEAGLSK